MKRALVIAFFSLHTLSLGIGSVPSEAADPLSRGFRMLFEPVTGLYLNATGQWQKWNLFAPDPSRRSLTYDIDFFQGEKRIASVPLAPKSIPWMRRTNLLKIMRNLWNDGEMYTALRREFLRSLCTR